MGNIREMMIEKLIAWYRHEIRWMLDLETTRHEVEYYVNTYREQLRRLEDNYLLALYTREIKLVG